MTGMSRSHLDCGPNSSRRARAWWSIGAAAVPLAAAIVLCAVGLSDIADSYDGIVSSLNPVAAGACCGAVLLLQVAALTGSLVAAKSTERPR